ncbi:MAG: serine hydrolase domain-containing protein [Thermaurantiacus sp.]
MTVRRLLCALGLALLALPGAAQPAAPTAEVAAALPEIERLFDDWRRDARAPGLVWGIVHEGRLVALKAEGVQDLRTRAPVTADTAFRIASMTKAFTALAILMERDAGRLRLDDAAAAHVPEMRGWQPATADSPAITIRDLLHHTSGHVTDNPWGDRQQAMSEADFTAYLAAGFPRSRGTATAYEYSNVGYATLGRIVQNTAGRDFAAHVTETLLRSLGMGSTTFEVRDVPATRLARGYRWLDARWVEEPTMEHGAFGAMGGLVTTANDYARWLAFLLSGWPAGEARDTGPVRAATLREMVQGNGFPESRARPGRTAATGCRLAAVYGMGLRVAQDCDLGLTLSHGGGYPGYGSFMLLLPEAGVGIFAFANRTYGAPTGPVWDAALALKARGAIRPRSMPVSPTLAEAYRTVARVWERSDIEAAGPALAMNMLMDKPARIWRAELQAMKANAGACDTAAPLAPTGAMSGTFQWRCETGRISGELLLSPEPRPRIQELRLRPMAP